MLNHLKTNLFHKYSLSWSQDEERRLWRQLQPWVCVDRSVSAVHIETVVCCSFFATLWNSSNNQIVPYIVVGMAVCTLTWPHWDINVVGSQPVLLQIASGFYPGCFLSVWLHFNLNPLEPSMACSSPPWARCSYRSVTLMMCFGLIGP